MIIEDVQARLYTRELPSNLRSPVHRWDKKAIVLVFISTTSGELGIGEANTAFSDGIGLLHEINNRLAPKLRGRSVYDVRAISSGIRKSVSISQDFFLLGGAQSAVDIAIWDLIGSKANLPIHRLLGTFSNDIPGYASAGLYKDDASIDALADEMCGYVSEGHTAVKLKVGGAAVAEDIARVQAVRAAIGEEVLLMVDATGSMSYRDAIRFETGIRDLNVYWFEAPLDSLDVTGLAEFRAETSVPIASHENQYGVQSYDRQLRLQAIDFAQYNVTGCGGITDAMNIDAVSRVYSKSTALQFAGSMVGFLASLHSAAISESCVFVERHKIHQWLTEFATGKEWSFQNGHYQLSGSAPGLGVSNDVKQALLDGD